MKRIIILLLACVSLAAGKSEQKYNAVKVIVNDGVNVFERRLDNTISIRGGEIHINGGHNMYFIIMNAEYYNGYTLYYVNGGKVEVHHNKVFVRVFDVDNVYCY